MILQSDIELRCRLHRGRIPSIVGSVIANRNVAVGVAVLPTASLVLLACGGRRDAYESVEVVRTWEMRRSQHLDAPKWTRRLRPSLGRVRTEHIEANEKGPVALLHLAATRNPPQDLAGRDAQGRIIHQRPAA